MADLPTCLKAALVEVLENDAEAEQVLRLAAPYVVRALDAVAPPPPSSERERKLEEALREVRRNLEQADPLVLTCTLWMLDSPSETVVDFITASLAPAGGEHE